MFTSFVYQPRMDSDRFLSPPFHPTQRKGTTESTQASVDAETETKLKAVKESFSKNRDAVVKKLLDRVVLVTPELHRNLTKIESQ